MKCPPHYCFFSLGSWEINASLTRLRHLGTEFLRRGLRVTYLVDDLPFNRQGLALSPEATVEFVSPAQGLGQFAARRAILRRIQADYVHVLDPSAKSWLTLRSLPEQKLVVDWDEWLAQKPLGWSRNLREAFLERWHRRRASLLVVASHYMQDQFTARYGVSPLYLPYATYEDVKPAAASPFTEPTAVYMGSLFAGYDHDLIFEAAVLLRKRGLTPRIEFVGFGPQLERWRQFVREQGLENVHLPGYLPADDMWARLRHAHVLLFPIRPTIGNLSRCPSKTYAYAQTRRPVITCRVGEVPHTLGDKAQYIDPTPQAFADALAGAMTRSQPDVDYGIERHNWAARADTLLAALQSLNQNPSDRTN